MGPAWDNAKDGIMSEEDYPYERKVPSTLRSYVLQTHKSFVVLGQNKNIAGRGMSLQQEPSCGKRHWP